MVLLFACSALACGLDHQTKAVKVKYVCDGEIVLSISDRTTDNTYADWSQYVYDNCPDGMTITNTTASAINTLGNVQTLKVTATVEEEPDPEVIVIKEDRKLCGDDVISFEVIGTWDSFTIRANLVEGMCFRSEQTGGVNIVPVAMWRESDVDHYYTECVVYYSITVVPHPSEEEPELATVRINICEGDGIIHNQWVDGSVEVVNTYEFEYEVGYCYNLADEFDIPSNMVCVNNNGVSNVRFYLHEGVNYINIYVD